MHSANTQAPSGDNTLSCPDNLTIPVTSLPRRHQVPQGAPSSMKTTPKEAPLHKCLQHCAHLANLGWDLTSQTLQLPVLMEKGEMIYSLPDRATINENMANMFNNIPKSLHDSTDFLNHEVDLPNHDPLVYAQCATSYYKVTSMQSIKLMDKSKKCFHWIYLIPTPSHLP